MPVFEIPAEIETQYEDFAQQNGKTKDALMREALVSYLEDLHDVAVAKERLANVSGTISLEEIKRKFGLDD